MKINTPRAATVLIAALLATPVALLAADDAKQTANVPAPSASGKVLPGAATADQATAAKLAHGLLSDSRYAYRPRQLNDQLSAEIYRRYFDSLDGQKLFFTQGDMARFSPLRSKMDDAIRNQDLKPAYDIFSVYQRRVDERVAFARALLAKPFDFSG